MGGGACSEPEDHLLPDARAALALSVAERIRYAQRDRWIGYSAAETVLQRLRDLVQEPRQNRSHGILVAGRPNNGKTSLLARFRTENPFVVLSDGTCEGPVVSMQMPDEPDEGKFWSQMLLALKIPHRASDPAKVLKGQAKDTLEAQRGRMLLIVSDSTGATPLRKRMSLRMLSASLAAATALSARAEPLPSVIANYVNEICESRNADCSNYLLGVKEGLALSKDWKACLAGADTDQLRLAFRLYASQHPDELAAPAARMASEAFRASFSCP